MNAEMQATASLILGRLADDVHQAVTDTVTALRGDMNGLRAFADGIARDLDNAKVRENSNATEVHRLDLLLTELRAQIETISAGDRLTAIETDLAGIKQRVASADPEAERRRCASLRKQAKLGAARLCS